MADRNCDIECKIYIGGLGDDANRYDLEDAFAVLGVNLHQNIGLEKNQFIKNLGDLSVLKVNYRRFPAF